MTQNKAETVRSIIKTQIQGRKPKTIRYTFACECGKAYDSYPALYLHFKRSHQIKITTKIEGVSNRVERRENQRIFTYFYSNYQKQVKTEDECDSCIINQVKLVLQEFHREAGIPSFCHYRLYWAIQEFEEHVNCRYEKEKEGKNSKVFQIPNYFNSFVIENEQTLMDNKIYSEFCSWLLLLGDWLQFKKYSNYIVLRTDSFELLY